MPEKAIKAHSLALCNNLLTVEGIVKVVEISEREAQFKLSQNTLLVRGSGLNVVKLDRAEGVVQLELQSLQSLTYRQSSFKGLFR